MDFTIVLSQYSPGENVSPLASDPQATYEQIAATWRGAKRVPTLAELQTLWAQYLATNPEYGLTGDALAKQQAKAVVAGKDTQAATTRALLQTLAQLTGKSLQEVQSVYLTAVESVYPAVNSDVVTKG